MGALNDLAGLSNSSNTSRHPLIQEGATMGTGDRSWRFTEGEWVEIPSIELARSGVEFARRRLAEAEKKLAALEATDHNTPYSRAVAGMRASRLACVENALNPFQRLANHIWQLRFFRSLSYVVSDGPEHIAVSSLFVQRKHKRLRDGGYDRSNIVRIHLASPNLRARIVDGRLIEIVRAEAVSA